MEHMVRNGFSLTPKFLLYGTNTWIVVVVYVTYYFPVIINRDTKCRCFYSVFAIELMDVINVNGCSYSEVVGLFGCDCRRAATDGEQPATGWLVLRTPETLNSKEGCVRDVRRAESLQRERRAES